MDQTPDAPTRRLTIVLKMPDLLQERLLAFPFVHLVREAYKDADLHFVCSKHRLEVLYSLPFQGCFWHEWDEGEIKTPFDVHRYATTLAIPEVDLYVSLGESVNELVLGTFLRAKKRVAFAEGWKAWFTSLAVKRPVGHHVSEELFALFQEMTNQRVPEKLRVMGRELPPVLPEGEDVPPYLAVDLWPFSPGKLDGFWQEYFELFEGKRFVLFFSEEAAKGALLAEKFIERLPPRNRYELFLNPNWIELGKMLAHAKGLVTRAGSSATYATYLGTDALIMYERGDPKRDAPFYNFANWQLLDVRDPSVSGGEALQGVLKLKATVDPAVLFKRTLEMFKF